MMSVLVYINLFIIILTYADMYILLSTPCTDPLSKYEYPSSNIWIYESIRFWTFTFCCDFWCISMWNHWACVSWNQGKLKNVDYILYSSPYLTFKWKRKILLMLTALLILFQWFNMAMSYNVIYSVLLACLFSILSSYWGSYVSNVLYISSCVLLWPLTWFQNLLFDFYPSFIFDNWKKKTAVNIWIYFVEEKILA